MASTQTEWNHKKKTALFLFACVVSFIDQKAKIEWKMVVDEK